MFDSGVIPALLVMPELNFDTVTSTPIFAIAELLVLLLKEGATNGMLA